VKKILIIDDTRSVTEFLKTYLERTGRFEVRTANAGRAGYEAAKAFWPDLIFLDVIMPDMTGSSVAEMIKSDADLRKTPIVFMTGIVTKEEVDARGGMIGGYPYLAKPILAMSEFLDCIDANIQ
jgi:DNA-binding response OmpR family regulator